jgi:hypothetical protein
MTNTAAGVKSEELAKHLAAEFGRNYDQLVRLGFEMYPDALGTQTFWMKVAVKTLEVLKPEKCDRCGNWRMFDVEVHC